MVGRVNGLETALSDRKLYIITDEGTLVHYSAKALISRVDNKVLIKMLFNRPH